MATVASIVIHDAKNNDIRYYKKEKGYNFMKNFGEILIEIKSFNKENLLKITAPQILAYIDCYKLIKFIGN